MKFFSKNFQQTTVSGQASDSIASKRKEQFVGAAILEGNYFQGVHQHLVAASRCKGNSVLRHRAWKFQGTRLLVRFEAPWPAFDARTYTMHVSQQGFCKANGKRKERFIFKVQKYKRIWFILSPNTNKLLIYRVTIVKFNFRIYTHAFSPRNETFNHFVLHRMAV